jgi:hypothetical protein
MNRINTINKFVAHIAVVQKANTQSKALLRETNATLLNRYSGSNNIHQMKNIATISKILLCFSNATKSTHQPT